MQNKKLMDFSKNAKFKTSGTGSFKFFNVDDQKQIRIWKKEFKNQNIIRVTLHSISDDNITYNPAELNIPTMSLKDAKLEAAKIYFSLT